MSLHFLIDGYNLVKTSPAFADKPLRDGRAGLIAWLTIARPQGSVNNRVTVVFDGRSDVFFDHPRGEIEVVFTQDTTADERIRMMVEDHPRVKEVVVVSNDKEITLYARALGASIVSIEQFTVGLKRGRERSLKPHQVKKIAEVTKKNISHTQADAINKELRKLWTKHD